MIQSLYAVFVLQREKESPSLIYPLRALPKAAKGYFKVSDGLMECLNHGGITVSYHVGNACRYRVDMATPSAFHLTFLDVQLGWVHVDLSTRSHSIRTISSIGLTSINT